MVQSTVDTVTIADFDSGSGGDILTIHAVSGGVTGVAGGIVAANTGVIVNVIAAAGDNVFIVDTVGIGYASVAAFETAVEAANATTIDYMGMYYDTTDDVVKLVADASSAIAGSSIVLATFTDVTTAAASDLMLDAFASTNLIII